MPGFCLFETGIVVDPKDARHQEQQANGDDAALIQLVTLKAWMFVALGLGLALLGIFAILWAMSGT